MIVHNKIGKKICPAYAGMILKIEEKAKLLEHLSRVCGDDPQEEDFLTEQSSFVPRMRG